MATTTCPAYVEVGQCPKCKAGWRTNDAGDVKKHAWGGKPCGGSYKTPLARATVAKATHRPGEKWPKRRM